MKRFTIKSLVAALFGLLLFSSQSYATNHVAKVGPSMHFSPQETVFARPGQEVMIPVTVNQAVKVAAISLIFHYPAEDLDIESVEPATSTGFTEYNAKGGELRIAWFSLDPLNLEAGDAMIWVKVRLNNEITTGKNIEFLPDPTSEIANEEANRLSDVNVSVPQIKSTLAAVKHVITVANYSFTPQNLTGVIVGDTIEWVISSGTHTTTSKLIPASAPSWDAVVSSGSPKYDYKVYQAGLYNYVCTPHEAMGMTGTFTATPGSGVGITDLTQNKLMLEITPNPAINDCQVIYAANTSGPGVMRMLDMLGNVVMDKPIEIVTGKNMNQFAVGSLKPGMYQVQLITADGQVVTKKLIKP